MIRVYLLLLVIVFFTFAQEKQVFTEEKILQYLTIENPYIYTIFGEKPIFEAKIKFFKGSFDTRFFGKYERKKYPLSESKFASLFFEKPTISGIDILFGYRKATGVQEFSNTKTSKNGELLLGLKIPIVRFINNIDTRRLNLFSAQLNWKSVDFKYKDSYRKLYYDIVKAYYYLIYYKQVLELEKKLYKKAQERYSFVEKKVKVGSFPEVYLVEAMQQIINRRQRVLKAQNDYQNQLNSFVRYINLSPEEFVENFTLPDLPQIFDTNIDEKKAIEIALQNRPDLRQILIEKKKVSIEKKYYSLFNYPKVSLSIYNTYDIAYQQGFKFSVDFEYFVERRKFLGKNLELTKKIILLNKNQEKLILDIKTKLKNILGSIKNTRALLDSVKEEVKVAEKLRTAEERKFILGAGNLFMLNQREIYTLQTKKKYLKYKLKYILLYKELLKELNLFRL